MVKVKNIAHAQELLGNVIPSNGTVYYTLDRMQALMAYLGNPQDKLKIVHIAGTSGKTSTSYYAASLLFESGYKVGLCVSPHVDSIVERAQINLHTPTEELYCQELGIFLDLVKDSELEPTYFETLVAFSFWFFDRQNVDYAVIEVGLGGLLDATNVIHRDDKICLITDIGFDHTKILGKTLPEIATQKAGIIHKQNQVFMHTQLQEVINVVEETSIRESAHLHIVDIDESITKIRGFNKLPSFQQRNFSLVYEALKNLTGPPEVIEKALLVHIPARMEEVTHEGRSIILDGSHNEQKIEALVEAMKKKYAQQSIVVVVAFGENKSTSLEGCLKFLREISSHIIVTKFTLGDETTHIPINPKIIAKAAKELGFVVDLEEDPRKAFEFSLMQPEQLILVTGSFYLLNHIRTKLQLST